MTTQESPRPPLTALVNRNTPGDQLGKFDTTEAAAEYAPLPRGVYEATVETGGLTVSPNKKTGYQLTFRVTAGEHSGRQLRKTYWLTDAAMTYSKRDLAKFGLTTEAKLKAPFDGGRHVVKLDVVLKTDDDGRQWNEVKAVTVVRVQEPEPNPFPPPTSGGDAQ